MKAWRPRPSSPPAWAMVALTLVAPGGGARARAEDAGAVSFSTESGVAVVPFEDLGGLVVVPVRIGDSRPLRFVLDSGAGRMAIDGAVADELSLRREGSGYVMGAGGGA